MSQAETFIQFNENKVLQQGNIFKIDQDILRILFYKSPLFLKKELLIFQSLMAWINRQNSGASKDMKDYLKIVAFNRMNTKEVLKCVKKYPKIVLTVQLQKLLNKIKGSTTAVTNL